MAVQVLVDHGVPEEKIVFVTYFAGRMGKSPTTHFLHYDLRAWPRRGMGTI